MENRIKSLLRNTLPAGGADGASHPEPEHDLPRVGVEVNRYQVYSIEGKLYRVDVVEGVIRAQERAVELERMGVAQPEPIDPSVISGSVDEEMIDTFARLGAELRVWEGNPSGSCGLCKWKCTAREALLAIEPEKTWSDRYWVCFTSDKERSAV